MSAGGRPAAGVPPHLAGHHRGKDTDVKKLVARSLAVALPLTAVLALVTAAPALAHERRTVGGYQFVVGWGDEPAYSSFKNSIQVTLSEANGGAPVTDLGDTLKVEVTKGSDRATLPLVANFRVGAFGTPGDYRAWLTPTRPGTYTFHFTGTVRGQSVDETFTSSKTTFNDVEDVATSEFPAKDPSTGELATRLDREVPRLDSAATKAKDDAGSARTLAVVGIAVGAAGLVAAVAALVVARRGGAAKRRPPGERQGGATARAAEPEQPESLSR